MEDIVIEIIRGDTFQCPITVTRNNIAEDITDWKFYFTIKSVPSDTDDKAVLQKSWTNHASPKEGKTYFELTSTETKDLSGIYYYDIQWKTKAGYIQTPVKGKIIIIKDITRITS